MSIILDARIPLILTLEAIMKEILLVPIMLVVILGSVYSGYSARPDSTRIGVCVGPNGHIEIHGPGYDVGIDGPVEFELIPGSLVMPVLPDGH